MTVLRKNPGLDVKIYHNPRCSKSRQTLELLQEHGVDPQIVDYLSAPPGAAELRHILTMLGLPPRGLMRTREQAYRDAGLDNPDLADEELIRAMIEHPILIQRPIVIVDGRAVIGRPPERVLDLL